MIQNYRDLTRKEMEAVDKENTIVMIPLGAIEQHGSQAPLGTDSMIAEAMPRYVRICPCFRCLSGSRSSGNHKP